MATIPILTSGDVIFPRELYLCFYTPRNEVAEGIMFLTGPSVSPSVCDNNFRQRFLRDFWWQGSEILSAASIGGPISWDPISALSGIYFLFYDFAIFSPIGSVLNFRHIFFRDY